MTSHEPDRPYNYFVSYNWGGGYGSSEFNLSHPIRGWSDISLITGLLAESFRRNRPLINPGNIVIVNYQLMSGPEDGAAPDTPAQLVAEQALREVLALVDQLRNSGGIDGPTLARLGDLRQVASRGLGGRRG